MFILLSSGLGKTFAVMHRTLLCLDRFQSCQLPTAGSDAVHFCLKFATKQGKLLPSTFPKSTTTQSPRGLLTRHLHNDESAFCRSKLRWRRIRFFWLRQQMTRPRRSQSHRSCKRNDTKRDCDSAIGQHLLENDQCALNYDNKRFSILATACSSFHLNFLEAAYIGPGARFYADRKSLFTLSNSFNNRGIWPPAVLSLTFAIAKFFLWRALQY